MIKRLFGPVSIGTRDQHSSIFFDFDNGSGCFLDLSDGLTTRSDQQADFIRLDFGFDQARSIRKYPRWAVIWFSASLEGSPFEHLSLVPMLRE